MTILLWAMGKQCWTKLPPRTIIRLDCRNEAALQGARPIGFKGSLEHCREASLFASAPGIVRNMSKGCHFFAATAALVGGGNQPEARLSAHFSGWTNRHYDSRKFRVRTEVHVGFERNGE